MLARREIPSLVDLCVRTAIDNIRYIGDVGETDVYLLAKILPHCTVDQLEFIENSTQDRDLSSVTDRLWKRFYEQSFGVESVNLVLKRMKQKRVVFKWRLLYEAKKKEREQAQKKSVDRLRQRYKEAENRKQSRKIQICSKVPPASNKRNFSGGLGYNLSNVKGNLMKKAKLEYLNSHEVKMQAFMRKNQIQKGSFPYQSVSQSMGTGRSIASSSGSTSKPPKHMGRR